jgi:hypothetical protein
MNQPVQQTKVDDIVHGLRCICGGAMVLTLVEPIDDRYERHRFECIHCGTGTTVSFQRS